MITLIISNSFFTMLLNLDICLIELFNPLHGNDAYMRRESLAFFWKKKLPLPGFEPGSVG